LLYLGVQPSGGRSHPRCDRESIAEGAAGVSQWILGHLQADGYPGFRTLFQSGQDPKSIRYVYFGILSLYTVFGITMLCLEPPVTLLFIGTLIMNFALGSTCLHTLVVNTVLLPRPLRPGWFCRISLFMAGLFFLAVATISTWTTLQARGII
jgi:hypothetical protein